MSYIILENHSTVYVFCNPTLLRNICTSDQTLYLICNAGTVPVNQVGDLPGYGHIWYHPKDISNIIGLSNVADIDKYWVHYPQKRARISSSLASRKVRRLVFACLPVAFTG